MDNPYKGHTNLAEAYEHGFTNGEDSVLADPPPMTNPFPSFGFDAPMPFTLDPSQVVARYDHMLKIRYRVQHWNGTKWVTSNQRNQAGTNLESTADFSDIVNAEGWAGNVRDNFKHVRIIAIVNLKYTQALQGTNKGRP